MIQEHKNRACGPAKRGYEEGGTQRNESIEPKNYSLSICGNLLVKHKTTSNGSNLDGNVQPKVPSLVQCFLQAKIVPNSSINLKPCFLNFQGALIYVMNTECRMIKWYLAPILHSIILYSTLIIYVRNLRNLKRPQKCCRPNYSQRSSETRIPWV